MMNVKLKHKHIIMSKHTNISSNKIVFLFGFCHLNLPASPVEKLMLLYGEFINAARQFEDIK